MNPSTKVKPLKDNALPSVLLSVFSGFEYGVDASLLINHPGPAVLLCGVGHCGGLIWLHRGPSLFQNRRALSADQTALGPSLCTRSPFIWKRSRFGPCRSISPPSVCVSACQSLSRARPFRHASVASAFLFPASLSLLLPSAVLSVPHLASITSPTNKRTHLTHLLS